jgi:hypothetical protein
MILNKTDLEVINKIVEENNISYFKLIQQSGAGIGYITDLEFETDINGRLATVKMPVSDEDQW